VSGKERVGWGPKKEAESYGQAGRKGSFGHNGGGSRRKRDMRSILENSRERYLPEHFVEQRESRPRKGE
jgi:hypothetical protein